MEHENQHTGGVKVNEAAKAARRAYKRKWQREHPDKVKQYQEAYWTRKAQEAAKGDNDKPAEEPAAE